MAKNSLMTNYELAKWLALGFGQKQNSPNAQIRMYHNYFPEEEDLEVDSKIRVIRWNESDWIVPTYQVFREDMISIGEDPGEEEEDND